MCVAYRGVHGYVEARGWHGSLLKSFLTVYVDVDSLIWAMSSLFSYYDSITCSRDSLGGSSESWDYRWVAMHTDIYMDAWDLNSGPQIFIASTLPTEPWHQPQLLFFFLWPNTWQETAEGERFYFGSQCEPSWRGSPGCRHWKQLHPQPGNREINVGTSLTSTFYLSWDFSPWDNASHSQGKPFLPG